MPSSVCLHHTYPNTSLLKKLSISMPNCTIRHKLSKLSQHRSPMARTMTAHSPPVCCSCIMAPSTTRQTRLCAGLAMRTYLTSSLTTWPIFNRILRCSSGLSLHSLALHRPQNRCSVPTSTHLSPSPGTRAHSQQIHRRSAQFSDCHRSYFSSSRPLLLWRLVVTPATQFYMHNPRKRNFRV
jgi:hypothetical protein